MENKTTPEQAPQEPATDTQKEPSATPPTEVGGSRRPEPTRYGDWEVGGICTDF